MPVDGGPGRDAAHPEAVVPRRNDPGHCRAVVFEGVVYVALAGVVEIAAGVDVGSQVLVIVVHPVVNNGDVDALAGDAFLPDRLDVYVLPLVFMVFQVPLTGIQVVAGR